MKKPSVDTVGNSVGVPTGRLHYLDWLRVIAIFGVFIYHSARPFLLQDWLIRNTDQSIVLSFIFLIFLGSWGMPLFFLMAGTGSRFALRRRSGGQFLSERLKRLVIPLLVGCIVLSPIQFYVEWVHKGWYRGSFLTFIPELLRSWGEELTAAITPSVFEFIGSHLWFLGFLFTYSLLALPLFLWFKSPSGRRLISWIGGLADRRLGLLIFILPVALARVLLQPLYPGYADWSDFTYMFLFFIYGYILYADERLVAAIKRDGGLAFGVGAASTVVMLVALAAGVGREWIESPGTVGFNIAWSLASINGWCWTVAALSFGMRVLNRRTRLLNYSQEAILPFYVFHQPAIVAIAYFAVTWAAAVGVKYLVIALISFSITIGVHELIIRRLPPARALFGVKAPAG
jgi:glucan biosynthesis protein C